MEVSEKHFAWTASNITLDPETGIGTWSEQDFDRAMRQGIRPDGRVLNPFMPWPGYARWSDDDMAAVWAYLQAVQPERHPVPPTRLTGVAATGHGSERGEALFAVYCVICHGPEGEGGRYTQTAMAETARVLDDETLASTIANGMASMPAFSRTLNEAKIRDLVAYIREFAPRGGRVAAHGG